MACINIKLTQNLMGFIPIKLILKCFVHYGPFFDISIFALRQVYTIARIMA